MMLYVVGAKCAAMTYDGLVRKQCTRPGAVDRDGRQVCRGHSVVERITFVDGARSVLHPYGGDAA